MYRSIWEELLVKDIHSLRIETKQLGEIFKKNYSTNVTLNKFPITLEGVLLGEIETDAEPSRAIELTHHLAVNLRGVQSLEQLHAFTDLLNWVEEARKIAPEVVDWIGLYFKASWLLREETTDLVLGPYLGEVTNHVRIPIDRGMCGLALREEKIVNVEDVTKESSHIACSLKTRSELVLPLTDELGNYIAELDIDSNVLNAFSKEVENKYRLFIESFPSILKTFR